MSSTSEEEESSSSTSTNKHYYRPNINRPFTPTTSKRSSVQALTSIQHLQHSYSKLAFVQQVQGNNSNTRNLARGVVGEGRDGIISGMVMEEPEEMDKENDVLGSSKGLDDVFNSFNTKAKKGNRGLRISSLTSSRGLLNDVNELEFPPSPAIPSTDRKMPWELESNSNKTNDTLLKLGRKELKKEILELLAELCDRWGLINNHSYHSNLNSKIRDLNLSNSTTSSSSKEVIEIGVDLSNLIKSTTLGVRTIQRHLISLPSHHLSNTTSYTTKIRQSSLLVLGTLQELKYLYKLPSSTSPSTNIEPTPYDFGDNTNEATQEAKEEEIIEYRTDIHLEDLRKEVEIIREYVEVVDRILIEELGNKNLGSSRRVVSETSSAGNGTIEEKASTSSRRASGLVSSESSEGIEGLINDESLELQEEELPEWARPECYSTELDRVHAILAAHLDEQYLSRLVSPSISTQAFLESILDGSLLCFAYNAVLRDSSRPFGFIPHSSIHLLASSLNDSVSSEGSTNKDKLGSTFRKIENLNMFAAALKFRYLINLTILPNQFDAKKIARKESWEMLENMVKKWMEAVVSEKREEVLNE